MTVLFKVQENTRFGRGLWLHQSFRRSQYTLYTEASEGASFWYGRESTVCVLEGERVALTYVKSMVEQSTSSMPTDPTENVPLWWLLYEYYTCTVY